MEQTSPPRSERPASEEAPGRRWLAYHKQKSLIRREYPSVWSAPAHRKRGPLLRGLLKPGARVLDVGAGGRSWEPKVLEAAAGVEYRSLDQDRSTRQDWYSLDDVEGLFDLVLLIEVIEHLGFEEGVLLLRRLRTLLAPEGHLLLTTPNVRHPVQWWQDPTHRTPWAYEFLGGVLLEEGYGPVRLARTEHAGRIGFQLARLWGWIALRPLGLDFAGTIAITAGRGAR